MYHLEKFRNQTSAIIYYVFRKVDNIAKVSFIQFFSSLYFYLPILTIYYQRRGLDYIQINSLWGILIGTIFLFEIPTGVIADKFGRKISVILALIFQLLGEVLFLFAQNYFHFFLISIIAGIGFAFQSGCLQALVYDSLKEQNQEGEMKKTTGTIEAFFQSGNILGALGSSLLITSLAQFQITLTILLTIVSVGIAFLVSLFLQEPQIKYKHLEENPINIIVNSISLIKQNPSLKKIILLGILTTPFAGYLRNLHPPYFQLLHVPVFWLGLSLALGGVLAVSSSKYAYKLEKILGVEGGMFIATVLPGIFYILMSVIVHPVLGVLLFVLNYGSMSLQNPLYADYYNIHIQSEIRATTLSIINMFSSFYIVVMGLIIGWIANYSILYAFLFMGILILISGAYFRINKTQINPLII